MTPQELYSAIKALHDKTTPEFRLAYSLAGTGSPDLRRQVEVELALLLRNAVPEILDALERLESTECELADLRQKFARQVITIQERIDDWHRMRDRLESTEARLKACEDVLGLAGYVSFSRFEDRRQEYFARYKQEQPK